MASSGNFCTLNPLTEYDARVNRGNYSNGNLTYDDVGGDGWVTNMAMTHKTYCEYRIDGLGGYGGVQGLRGTQAASQVYDSVTFQASYQSGRIYHYKGDSDQSYSGNIGGTVSSGNIIMFAYDPATYKWWVGVNGTWRNSGDPANGTGYVFQGSATMFENMNVTFGGWSGDVNRLDHTWNFGQDSTFNGNETAGGNADENGFGDFKYSPPTGFLALCTGNMVISDDIDPAQTDSDYPGKNFNAVLYTGNGSASAKTIDGFNFSPDFIWVKSRSAAKNNMLVDNSRGGDKYMYSNATNAELTASNMITFGNSDGYVMRDDGTYLNENSGSYVAWGWKANGGTTSSDSNGDVSSTVQVNDKAGFSIVQYTGNLTSSGNTTVGHGLSKAPEFIIRKGRNQAERWAVSHIGLTSFNYMLELNSTAAEADKSGNGSMSAPTTTVFSNNYTDGYAVNGTTYIAYCWHSVDGYSKFGSYIGNYSTDGPFVYTGFRPKMLFVKRADGTNSWFVWDTTRTTFNKMNSYLYWDLTNAEETGYAIDVLSNGFKIKGQNNATNNSGGTFIFGAWGDVPFKYNNTF